MAYQRDIIFKLLDRPKQATSTSQARIPSGNSTHAPLITKNVTTTKLSNKSSTNNEDNTKEQKSPIVYEDIMEKSRGFIKKWKKETKVKNKAKKQLKANKNINNNEQDDKPVESKEKEVPSAITTNHNVIILGDSMVKNLQG